MSAHISLSFYSHANSMIQSVCVLRGRHVYTNPIYVANYHKIHGVEKAIPKVITNGARITAAQVYECIYVYVSVSSIEGRVCVCMKEQ